LCNRFDRAISSQFIASESQDPIPQSGQAGTKFKLNKNETKKFIFGTQERIKVKTKKPDFLSSGF